MRTLSNEAEKAGSLYLKLRQEAVKPEPFIMEDFSAGRMLDRRNSLEVEVFLFGTADPKDIEILRRRGFSEDEIAGGICQVTTDRVAFGPLVVTDYRKVEEVRTLSVSLGDLGHPRVFKEEDKAWEMPVDGYRGWEADAIVRFNGLSETVRKISSSFGTFERFDALVGEALGNHSWKGITTTNDDTTILFNGGLHSFVEALRREALGQEPRDTSEFLIRQGLNPESHMESLAGVVDRFRQQRQGK